MNVTELVEREVKMRQAGKILNGCHGPALIVVNIQLFKGGQKVQAMQGGQQILAKAQRCNSLKNGKVWHFPQSIVCQINLEQVRLELQRPELLAGDVQNGRRLIITRAARSVLHQSAVQNWPNDMVNRHIA